MLKIELKEPLRPRGEIVPFYTENAREVSTKQYKAVADYMSKDAGVSPVSRFPTSYMIPADEWPWPEILGRITTGKIQGIVRTTSNPLVLIKDNNNPADNNSTLIHEVLGHKRFYELFSYDDYTKPMYNVFLNPKQEEKPFKRLGEVFSNMLEVFATGDAQGAINSVTNGQNFGHYPSGTLDLLRVSLDLYKKIGKNATTSLFYEIRCGGPLGIKSTLAKSPSELEHRIYVLSEKENIMKAIAALSSYIGGKETVEMWRDNQLGFVSRAKKVENKFSYDPGFRKQLVLNKLNNEFGLGEFFSEMYISQKEPDLRELLFDLGDEEQELFHSAMAKRRSLAHEKPDEPDYNRGEVLFNRELHKLEEVDALLEANP